MALQARAVTTVTVDASVEDADGTFVQGLQAGAFTVAVNDVPVRLVSVEEIDAPVSVLVLIDITSSIVPVSLAFGAVGRDSRTRPAGHRGHHRRYTAARVHPGLTLAQLADATGGLHLEMLRAAPPSRQPDQSPLTRAAIGLQRVYRVTFDAGPLAPGFHRVSVRVGDTALKVRARAGVAIPSKIP